MYIIADRKKMPYPPYLLKAHHRQVFVDTISHLDLLKTTSVPQNQEAKTWDEYFENIEYYKKDVITNINWERNVLVISIDGPSGSGKTKLMKYLHTTDLCPSLQVTTIFQHINNERLNDFPVHRLPFETRDAPPGSDFKVNLLDRNLCSSYQRQYCIYEETSEVTAHYIKLLQAIDEQEVRNGNDKHVCVLIVEKGVDGIQFMNENEEYDFSSGETDFLGNLRIGRFIPADETILLRAPFSCDDTVPLHVKEEEEHYLLNYDHPYIKKCTKLNDVTKSYGAARQKISNTILRFRKQKDKYQKRKRKLRGPCVRSVLTRSMTEFLYCYYYELTHGRKQGDSRI